MNRRGGVGQLIWRTTAALVLTGAFLLLNAPATQAMVPPASLSLLAFLRSCEVRIVVTPMADPVTSGDTLPVRVAISRLKGGASPLRGQLRINDTQIDLSSSGLSGDSFMLVTPENVPGTITFKTNSAIGVNQTVEVIANLQTRSGLVDGSTLRIEGLVWSLTGAGQPMEDCVSRNMAAIVKVKSAANPQFDLAPTIINPLTSALALGEMVELSTIVRNTAQAVTPVITGTQFQIKYSYPSSLRMYSLDTRGTHDSTSTMCSSVGQPMCLTTVTEELGVDQEYPIKFMPVLTAVTAQESYQVTACIEVIKNTQFETPTDNNCATVTIAGSLLQVKKTWEDQTRTRRQNIEPNQELVYRVSVKNVSLETLSDVRLFDLPMSSTDCNAMVRTDCPVWDKTFVWDQSSLIGITEDPATGRLTWNQPLTLSPGQEQSYEVRARVVDEATLRELMKPKNYQDRCNGAYATVGTGSVKTTSRVCWSYKVFDGANLSIDHSFKVGSSSQVAANVKEGELLNFAITAKNTGNEAATDMTVVEDVLERIVHSSGHIVAWEPESLPAGVTATESGVNHTLNGWPQPTLAAGAEQTINPRLGVACDAYDRLRDDEKSGPVISAVARIDAANDITPNNNQSNELLAMVRPGHYKLGGFGIATPTKVVPGNTNSNTTTLVLTLTNQDANQAVDVAVPAVKVSFRLPEEFEVVTDAANSAFQVVDGQVIFDRVNVGINGSTSLRIKVKVKDEVPTGRTVFRINAQSLTHGQDCGEVTFPVSVDTEYHDYDLVKSVVSPTGEAGIGQGERARFQLRITNYTQYDVNHPLEVIDPLDAVFTYSDQLSGETCVSSVANFCGVEESGPVYSSAEHKLTWNINRLPAGATVTYEFNVGLVDPLVLDVCPKDIQNSPVSPDSQRTVVRDTRFNRSKAFNTATVKVYSNSCLSGNIYANNQEGNDGITIKSTDIVIDGNSILSARGTVECGDNVSCIQAPYKIGKYATGEGNNSVGLRWETVLTRMHRNIQRLRPGAESIAASTLPSTFNLYGSAADAAIRNPEGKVWLREGDLTIDTSNLQLSGVGTIIVEGNLTITGNGSLEPTGGNRNALGLIVLPKNGQGGNVYIDGRVRRIVGAAIYAPGTANGLVSGNIAGSGLIEFRLGESSLRPARGLFMARQFIIPEEKNAVFQYDQNLNTAAGAPPGFSFTTSPNATQEGS